MTNKIDIFFNESTIMETDTALIKNGNIGFYVTDGEHYQLFKNTFQGIGLIKEDCLKSFYHNLVKKFIELVTMFERWEEKSEYLTEINHDYLGQVSVKNHPKPKKYWTTSEIKGLQRD